MAPGIESMHSKIPLKYYAIPFLYVVIIASLLYSFIGRAVRVRESVGDMVLTAITPARSASGPPSSIEVGIGDLILDPGSGGIVVRSPTTEDIRLGVRDFRIDDETIHLEFPNDIKLQFERIGENRFHILVNATGGVDSIGIPIASELSQPDLRVPLFLSGDTGASLTARSGYEPESKLLFVALVGGRGEIVAGPASWIADPDPFLGWIDRHFLFDESDPAAAKSAFVETTYTGWVGERYAGASATWRGGDGVSEFDEPLLSLMVGESLARGSFRGLYPRILQISQRHSDALSYVSTPLLGNIVSRAGSAVGSDQVRVAEIRSMLEERSLRLFAQFDLVPFLFDRAPFALVGELVLLARTIEPGAATPKQSVGAARFLASASSLDPTLSAASGPPLEHFRRLVFPHVQVSDGKLFIGENSTADIESTLRGGLLLEEISAEGTLDNRVARAFIRFALDFTGEFGFLPVSVHLGSGAPVISDTRLRPESFFFEITPNPYRAREISLFPTLGPGSWLWIAAGDVEISSTPEELALSFDFPVGSAHHFFLKGIDPFESMTMFAIPWKSDPLFQNYTSGWVYDEESRTLFVKVTHKTTRERIVIAR